MSLQDMEVLKTIEVIFLFVVFLVVRHHLVIQTCPLFVGLVEYEQ
jgi:hypothetical protein